MTVTRMKIVIWGRGGHAKVVTDILKLGGTFEVAGYLDDVNPPRPGETYLDRPVFFGREHLPILMTEGIHHLVLGFGDCRMRLELMDYVKDMGFELPVVRHPSAVVAGDVKVGEGTVIAAGAVVAVGVDVGRCAIVNTLASVDHNSTVGDGAHLSPGARLAGDVQVGRGVWIGIGSAVTDKLALGDGCVLGAGSVVVSDIPERVLAYGVPARVIRELQPALVAASAAAPFEEDPE